MGGHPAHRWGTSTTLRSSWWDGPPPTPGDLLVTPAGSWYKVDRVAAGAGCGHYRLDVTRLAPPGITPAGVTVFTWRWARRARRGA